MLFTERLAEHVRACFTGIWIESHEHEDALREIARLCSEEKWSLATWDIDRGLRLSGREAAADSSGADPLAAIRALNSLAKDNSSALLVLPNFHRVIQSAEVVQALAHQIAAGKQNRTFVVIFDAKSVRLKRDKTCDKFLRSNIHPHVGSLVSYTDFVKEHVGYTQADLDCPFVFIINHVPKGNHYVPRYSSAPLSHVH